MANANRAANGATQQATRNNDDEQCAQMPTARDGQAAVEQHLSALAETLFPARKELPRIPQQARSREKRDDLLKATATLFMERGYAQTTSDDIAAAAGVSVGTFYNYFRNKRQALMTLAIERLDEIFGNIQLAQMDFSHDNHRETIQQAVTAVLSAGQSGLRRVWQEIMSLEPELAPYQQHIRRYVLAQIEERLRQARQRRITWPDLDIEATALAILTVMEAANLQTATQISDERLIQTLTNMIDRSIFPPQTPQSSVNR